MGRVVAILLGLSVMGIPSAAAQEATPYALGGRTGYVDTLEAGRTQPYRLRPYVVPGTEQVVAGGVLLAPPQYRLDHRQGRLWVDPAIAESIRVVVARYQARPFRFKEVYRLHGISDASEAPADSTGTAPPVTEAVSSPDANDLFGNTRLHRSGSISRGVLAGNRRDISVESGLRMELSGALTDGVTVQALLTDENTPIQPDGTTQRLSEFDRVAIQLQARYGTSELGDFDLTFTGTEFARITRKLQGAALRANLPASEQGSVFGGGEVTVAGAAARGEYRVQEIRPLDGVQGPYRLEGANGEPFVIVVAGSEVVYMDGRRLERGETNDYVIDYQTGEITFTPSRIITNDRRISVEFQYTTYEFTRTLLGATAETRWWQRDDGSARARFAMSFLREADSRRFNAELGLTPLDSLLLVQSGDAMAARSGAEAIYGPYDPEALYVQYTRELRPRADGGADTVYVAVQTPPDPGETLYRVRFSRTGAGEGSYKRQGYGVNGIVYEYAGPGAGDYEPIRVLPKPLQKRLLDFSGSIEPVQGLEVFGEWAGSLHDQNRLSALDSADDRGVAYSTGVQLKPTDFFGLGQVSARYRRRHIDAHFEAFNRIRPVEFARQWNLVSRNTALDQAYAALGSESIQEAAAGLAFTPQSRLEGEWGRIRLGPEFAATRQAVGLSIAEAGLPALDYRAEYITSTDAFLQEQGTWLRQLGGVELSLLQERLIPRLEVEHEQRLQRVAGTDSLSQTSLAFVAARPGLSWTTATIEAGTMLEVRNERAWAQGTLGRGGREWITQTHLKYTPGRAFGTEAHLGFRTRPVEPYGYGYTASPDNTHSVALRWNGYTHPFERAISATWFYEALSERTPLLQEIYLRTDPEIGQFVWEDDGDGIVEVDEFIPERTINEGTYVRSYLPSDSLASVTGVQARFRLELDPQRRWRDEPGLKGLLANVSTRSSFEVLEKSTLPDISDVYLLKLKYFLDPATTMNGRIRVAQEIFLFRNDPRYGLDLFFSQAQGLSKMAAGEEARLLRNWRFIGRYRLNEALSFRLNGGFERNRVTSESYASRRYDIAGLHVHPEISLNVGPSMQLNGGVSYASKEDGFGQRQATVVRIPLEARYARVQKFQLTGRLEAANVSMRGEATGMAQYELTDGRGPGRSFLWNVDAQYALNAYLRASFTYDGRAPSNAPVFHMMRLQLTATF